MALSINHNLSASNVARNLQGHYDQLATSTQRLSSGLRVNSAADDAAGLAIRELMRADVSALQQGARNANDAISMLQVADGALAIIDEKLIRMKELSEQAATGTYDSTQRLMIASEFQAMGDEIDRIAKATDFNGLKLLDGSLSGVHDGSDLTAKGAMKIHFGSGNDSAEDYYYVDIGDCSLKGLGLAKERAVTRLPGFNGAANSDAGNEMNNPGGNQANVTVSLFDYVNTGEVFKMPAGIDLTPLDQVFTNGHWGRTAEVNANNVNETNNFMALIPKGTKNIVINQAGQSLTYNKDYTLDNDIQLFTKDGKHLAGTPYNIGNRDYVWSGNGFIYNTTIFNGSTLIDDNADKLGFQEANYDAAQLNVGPANYEPDAANLNFTQYNGMNIGYGGDPARSKFMPANWNGDWRDYEVLTIDEATEDLILWFPGAGASVVKAYWDLPDADFYALLGQDPPPPAKEPDPVAITEIVFDRLSIETQDKAQKALATLDAAIVKKDMVRAHLGALQNRLENTVANLNIQAENLLAAESRISDVDVGSEMTEFVRNQILTQASVAMLSQANSLPQMAMRLIGG